MNNKYLFKKLFLIVNSCLIILFLNSLIEKVVFAEKICKYEQLTVEDGLSQSTVKKILQDSSGYMWFATMDGLNRYNGFEYRILRHENGNENSLTSSNITDILEDKNGNLWVATLKGLNKVNKKTLEVKRIYKNINGKKKIYNKSIFNLEMDDSGNIWIATSNGLDKYNVDNDEITSISEIKSKELINKIAKIKDEYLWLATKRGIKNIDLKSNKLTSHKWNNDLLNYGDISAIYLDDDNQLWVGSKDGQVIKYSIDTKEVEEINLEWDKKFSSIAITDFLQVDNNRLILSTEKGAIIIDKSNDYKVNYEDVLNIEDFKVNNILDLYKDKKDRIWIGKSNGINLINPYQPFSSDFTKIDSNKIIEDNSIRGMTFENDKEIWFGTDNGGLYLYNFENEEFLKFVHDKDNDRSLSSNKISNVEIDNDGMLWISTSEGIDKLNTKDYNIKRVINNENSGIACDYIKDIFIDSRNTMWIGTLEGLYTYDKKTNGITNLTYLIQENLKDTSVQVIYEDSKGNIWIGSAIRGGVLKYNAGTREVKIYQNNSNIENKLSSNEIRDIREDGLGNIWIATTDGLNKIETSTDNITVYNDSNGLINNYICCVLIDKENNPWVSTKLGLSKYDIKNGQFYNYTKVDGLQESEFHSNASCQANDKRMVFGGINGINSFYPQEIIENNVTKADAFIDSIKVNDAYKDFTEDLKLKYYENNIEFKFFITAYESFRNNIYQYKLEGYDNEWITIENKNEVKYTNLKPGKYEFKVRGRSRWGEYSDIKTENFCINQQIWKTPIAIGFYILISILIIILLWKYIYNLEKIVSKRTKELNEKLYQNDKLYHKLIQQEKSKNSLLINLSHELRTPLNVILSSLQLIRLIIKENKVLTEEQGNKYLTHIEKNSKSLLEVINDLIDTSKLDVGKYNINIKEYDIVSLTEELTLSMKDYIESKGIDLIIDPEVEEKIIECDKIAIERCITNLLSNAAKFTNKGGTILVLVNDIKDKEEVEVIVKDTGVGIPKEQQKGIFDRFIQGDNSNKVKEASSGIGLNLVKNLVKLHHGDIMVESELNKGSLFKIVLPYKQPRKE
ncbi:ligand-binding sensor domain-containing protein [Clostridium chauvoei]|uniref:histidine kinase n=4 Tax=Clostridium chauvoei TaxID=46867 RepID=S6F9B9_9CLOT|nr:sensor histidine kinase [Clostridium chauvoei]ATD54992.1 hypothetical protein BTM20_06965 [Clostridium chauvoei]ATD57331.1 hypothetical protein BTM21_06095 [Clostridium chauvoei]MBX7281507.1 hypothetical protein [Clostridium chauvoei]MBX7284046.1 hypothetical protein [Clostridium chauvoei]MBX7286555.1 hypothetical protein [Clostridium chauvoei]